MPEPDLLAELAHALEAFDAADLAATVGALQLMPENAGRYLRLEAFAHTVATLEYQPGKPRISAGRLRGLSRMGILGSGPIADAEDPFDYPFTESFAFGDRGYIVFPGNTSESPTFVLRHIVQALLPDGRFSNTAFGQEARNLIHAALTVSDEVARRSGLERGMGPASEFRGSIIVPNASHLSRLKSAVFFQHQELSDLLAKRGLDITSLERLVLPFGSVTLDTYRLSDGPVVAHPILRSDSQFVVVNPGCILSAVRHQIVRLAVKMGVHYEFAHQYHRAVWDTAVTTLHLIKNDPVFLASDSLTIAPCFQDALFRLETDKLIYVALVTDPLNDYNPDEVFGQWEADDLGDRLEARLLSVKYHVFSSPQPPNEILTLFLSQGFGRWIMVGFNGDLNPMLSLMASDLETIAQLEGYDPLALWKFGHAAEVVRRRVMIAPTSTLNEFFYYRQRGHGYYLSDEEVPDLLVLDEGGAGNLRREVLDKRDWHAVPSRTDGHAVEVTTLHDTRAIPTYVTRESLNGNVEVLIEGLPLPVWVVQAEESISSQTYTLYVNFAELIAYWLWQFTPSLGLYLAPLSLRQPCLLIRLYLHPDDSWGQRPSEQSTAEDIKTQVDTTSGIITIELRAGITSLFYSADNVGERHFMRVILRAIGELLSLNDRGLGEESITAILDLHAPRGLKKKLLLIDPSSEPDLDTRRLPRIRKLQKSDKSQLLDELGEHLRTGMKLNVGPIPDDERTDVLQKVVGFYYNKLQNLVASLQPDGLLEWLVKYHEAIVTETAIHKQSIPTRLACFSSIPEMLTILEQESPDHTSAALASRFVIEYVTACPHSGFRPMSLEVYDRLQALAIHIINFGFESDLIHFKLADIKMQVLPSGRLGADRDEFLRARAQFLSVFTDERIARSTGSFARHWTDRVEKAHTAGPASKPDLLAQIDEAAEAEFGHSISELGLLMFEAIRTGRNISLSVASLPLEELVESLTTSLGWSYEKVRSAFDLLSLIPRSNFLQPPTPHPNWSVLPWRFNRSYSYVRRPFLWRAKGDKIEVLWGFRHLYVAWINLINLCINGRIVESRTRGIRELMGEINGQRGDAFNKRVAEMLEANPNLVVRSNVERFGKLRLASASGPLGDVDVLVADRRRRRLIPIECKDLAVARTPHEMANEITNLFLGHGQRKSFIEKHQNRVNWLQDNIGVVLAWLGMPAVSGWKVEPLVVVSQELFTPFLKNSPIRVLSFNGLRQEQANWG